MMMGGWFVATAIGNYLVAIIGYLWGWYAVVDGMECIDCLLSVICSVYFLYYEEIRKSSISIICR